MKAVEEEICLAARSGVPSTGVKKIVKNPTLPAHCHHTCALFGGEYRNIAYKKIVGKQPNYVTTVLVDGE